MHASDVWSDHQEMKSVVKTNTSFYSSVISWTEAPEFEWLALSQ